MTTARAAVLDRPMGTFRVESFALPEPAPGTVLLRMEHQLPLERVGDAIAALNGDYRVDGRAAVKIAIAPNGPVA